MKSLHRLATAGLFLAACGTVQIPKEVQCEEGGKNHFTGAAVTPGPGSPELERKLARIPDYGNHPKSWLAQRLFGLDDNVELTGEIYHKSSCIRHVAEDDDLEFYVKLSDESYQKLSTYFTPPAAAPHYVLVEMLASPPDEDPAPPFKTWRAKNEADRIQFSVDDQPPHPILAAGKDDPDWEMIRSGSRPYISVRGALVVDISEYRVGTGDLEMHPAEAIHLSSTPLH